MTNNERAKYIFQQLVERGAALPHTAVLCIETALNDLDIGTQIAQLSPVHTDTAAGRAVMSEVSAVCANCGTVHHELISCPGMWSTGDQTHEIHDEDLPHFCGSCGAPLTPVRPGKWQCDNPKCESRHG